MRAAALAGMAWGTSLLVAGERLWTAVAGRPPSQADVAVTRVLGARYLLQGVIGLALPQLGSRLVLAVDGLHASSMVGLAVADPSRRRPALVSAAVSGALVLVPVLVPVLRPPRFRPRHAG